MTPTKVLPALGVLIVFCFVFKKAVSEKKKKESLSLGGRHQRPGLRASLKKRMGQEVEK